MPTAKPITRDEIRELVKLLEKATPGPWYALWRDVRSRDSRAFEFVGKVISGNILTGCDAQTIVGLEVSKGSIEQARAHHDVEYIARAHELLPAILTHIAAQDATIALLRAECRRWREAEEYDFATSPEAIETNERLLREARAATDAANALEGE